MDCRSPRAHIAVKRYVHAFRFRATLLRLEYTQSSRGLLFSLRVTNFHDNGAEKGIEGGGKGVKT